MPTYSYSCTHCEHTFDKFLPMKENDTPTLVPCSNCGELKIKQVILSSNPYVDPHSVIGKKPPDEWRGFLKNLKAKNPGSNINIF